MGSVGLSVFFGGEFYSEAFPLCYLLLLWIFLKPTNLSYKSLSVHLYSGVIQMISSVVK